MRGRGTFRRLLLLAVACCTLAAIPATPASGFITSTIVVPITVGPAPGTGSTFDLTLVSLISPQGKTEAVSGNIGPTPFTGLLVFHSYDRPTDTGHYRLRGITTAGTPIDSLVDLTVDRYGKLVIVGLNGYVGSTPFALNRSVVIPL